PPGFPSGTVFQFALPSEPLHGSCFNSAVSFSTPPGILISIKSKDPPVQRPVLEFWARLRNRPIPIGIEQSSGAPWGLEAVRRRVSVTAPAATSPRCNAGRPARIVPVLMTLHVRGNLSAAGVGAAFSQQGQSRDAK